MRYMIYLIGFDERDKHEFDFTINQLDFEKVKHLYTGNSVLIHLETERSQEVLKKQITEISEKHSCWYFMSEFPDKLSCNLDDDYARILFDFDFNPPLEEEVDFFFDFEEDDDDDSDLVQMLKEKYTLKENEPTLDEILDKINQKGVSSLSFQEQAILKNYN